MDRQLTGILGGLAILLSLHLPGAVHSQTILERIRTAEQAGHHSLLLRAPFVTYAEGGSILEDVARNYEALLIVPEWGKSQSVYSPANDSLVEWSQYRILERLSQRTATYSTGPTPPTGLIPAAESHILLQFIGGSVRVNRNGQPVGQGEVEFRVTMNEEYIPDSWTNCAYLVFVRRDARYPRVGTVVGGWRAAVRLGVDGNSFELIDTASEPSTPFTESLANSSLGSLRQVLAGMGPSVVSRDPRQLKKKAQKAKAKARKKKKRKARRTSHTRLALTVPPPRSPAATRCYYDYKLTPRTADQSPDGRPVIKIQIGRSFDIAPNTTDPKLWNALNGCPGCIYPSATEMWNSDSQKPDATVARTPTFFQVDQNTATPDVVIELVEDNAISSDNCADINLDATPKIMRIPKSTYQAQDIQSLPVLLAHELGHSRGLDNEPWRYIPPSVMLGPVTRNGNACGGMAATEVSWLDKQTVSNIQSDGERTRLCRSRAKLYSGAGGGGDGGGGGPDPDPTPGGGGCTTNWTYKLYIPENDTPAWVEEYDGCGNLADVCSCSHQGGGEYDCGFCGVFSAPLES